MPTRTPRPDLEPARRAVLVRRPVHWEVVAPILAALEAAWRELDGGRPDAVDADPAPVARGAPPRDPVVDPDPGGLRRTRT